MAAAALPLALSPLGGGEGGGDTNNTPPLACRKKKRNGKLSVGGSRRPQPCTCAPGSLARAAPRCKLSTFFVPSAPPSPSRGCTSPLPYLYNPPAAPLPPLPAPPPHSPAPPMLAQLSPHPAPASPPRPRGRGLQSQPPTPPTNANEPPSQQTSSHCPSLPAESGGGLTGQGEGDQEVQIWAPQLQSATCTSKWSRRRLPFGAPL